MRQSSIPAPDAASDDERATTGRIVDTDLLADRHPSNRETSKRIHRQRRDRCRRHHFGLSLQVTTHTAFEVRSDGVTTD